MKKRLCIILVSLSVLAMVGNVPCSADEGENPVELQADVARWVPDVSVTASGNVKVTMKEITVTADSAEADLQTNVAKFTGNVKLTAKDSTVTGEDLLLNYKTGEWSFQNAISRIEPGAAGDKFSGPIFVNGEELSGTRQRIDITSGILTTCDREDPHYAFVAKEITIYPDSKIIARDVSLMILGRKLFTLKSMVIPTKGFSENLLPKIGTSTEEGLYLKAAYVYSATENTQGYLKLDLMAAKGVGIGMDQSYSTGDTSGKASIYYLSDKQVGGTNLTGSLSHRQKFGTVGVNLTTSYRTNNYLYYPQTTSQRVQLGLSHNDSNSNTTLTIADSTTRSSSTYETLTTSLRHTQNFSKSLTGMLSADTRTYKSSSLTAADKELNTNVELRNRGKTFDVTLTASKRFDLDRDAYTSDDNYSSLDRLPEISISTDTTRMGTDFFGLPSRFSFTAGQYYERPSDVDKGRLLFEWDLMGKHVELGPRTGIDLNAGYRQAYYDKDMAQYVLNYGGNLNHRFNDRLTARWNYSFRKPEGYSPFTFDYTGKYNYTRASLDYQSGDKMRWSLSTGYDFNTPLAPWQDISLRLTARPSSNFKYSISTGYDIDTSKWRTLTAQIKTASPEKYYLDLGVQYDLQDRELDLVRSRFDIMYIKGWKLQGIASWNGSTDKFDYTSFRLIKDLHCWEAIISYGNEVGFRTDKAIFFELRIKALPWTDRFGIGQYGQAVDTSMGDYYY